MVQFFSTQYNPHFKSAICHLGCGLWFFLMPRSLSSKSIFWAKIFWANYFSGSTIQHMRVNHCCPDDGVAQQFLDCAYVIASLQ